MRRKSVDLSQKAEKSQTDKPKTKKSKTTWRKDVIEILAFVVVAVVIVLSFNQILGLILHTDSPLVVVTSESMEPVYYGSNRGGNSLDVRKDMLVVRGVDPSEIEVGDVIVFNYIDHVEDEDVPIVHRVTRVYEDSNGELWFSTKGDNYITNNGFVIPPHYPRVDEINIHESRLVGKIVGRIPYLGGIYNYFQQGGARWILLVAVAVIFLLSIVSSMFDKDEEEDGESEVFKDDIDSDRKKGKTKMDEAFKEASAEDKEPSFFDTLKKFYRKLANTNIMLFQE